VLNLHRLQSYQPVQMAQSASASVKRLLGWRAAPHPAIPRQTRSSQSLSTSTTTVAGVAGYFSGYAVSCPV